MQPRNNCKITQNLLKPQQPIHLNACVKYIFITSLQNTKAAKDTSKVAKKRAFSFFATTTAETRGAE